MTASFKAAVAVLCTTLAVAAPPPASAGVIRGTLHVPTTHAQPAMTANAYPGRAGAMAGMHAALRGLVTDAVIYVDRVPARVDSSLAARAHVTPKLAQKDQSFVPRVVAIASGSSVDFPNMDPIYHNVFSLSPTRRFDLGKYPRGSSRRVEFRKPGLVNVFCDIHSDMEAFVLVVPNHAFTRPSATGDYALPDLPAGTYQVQIWHPDFGTQTQTVEVPETGDVLQAMSY